MKPAGKEHREARLFVNAIAAGLERYWLEGGHRRRAIDGCFAPISDDQIAAHPAQSGHGVGGLTTKFHADTNAHGWPLGLLITLGGARRKGGGRSGRQRAAAPAWVTRATAPMISYLAGATTEAARNGNGSTLPERTGISLETVVAGRRNAPPNTFITYS